MLYKKILGQKGENIACRYYEQAGFKLIAKNYWTRWGELDLVFKKNKEILVVEVKTRTNNSFGWGEESINQKKLNNIHQAYQIMYRALKLPSYYLLEICIIEIRGPQIHIRTYEL